jgi:hypothetical protein
MFPIFFGALSITPIPEDPGRAGPLRQPVLTSNFL